MGTSYRWILCCIMLLGSWAGTLAYAKTTEVLEQIPKPNGDSMTAPPNGAHKVGLFQSRTKNPKNYRSTDFDSDFWKISSSTSSVPLVRLSYLDPIKTSSCLPLTNFEARVENPSSQRGDTDYVPVKNTDHLEAYAFWFDRANSRHPVSPFLRHFGRPPKYRRHKTLPRSAGAPITANFQRIRGIFTSFYLVIDLHRM
jgi:hypothetical protein